jgi:hypothetical protein
MSRILETILPESIHNEGLLFVPQILEDLFRGKLDHDFPPRLDEGKDPASERSYAFDNARRLYKSFAAAKDQVNYRTATRTFIANFFHTVLAWPIDKSATANSSSPFLLDPFDPSPLEQDENALTTCTHFPIIVCPSLSKLDDINERFHGWGLSKQKRSATRFAQDFLNERDDALWALVTNGQELRLLRDNPSLTRPAFLSFDLNAILNGPGDFPAFALLWRLLHASRLDLTNHASPDLSGHHSLWEALRTRSTETGIRALTGLRPGIARAIEILGTGFLKNQSIRDALQSGELSTHAYEQELLRLAYRFLFLFVAEERHLLHTPDTPAATRRVYREGYSMARLRRLAARAQLGSSDLHSDLYQGVSIVFNALAHGEPRLGLTALGGIFDPAACPHLQNASLTNSTLIAAMRTLRYIDAGHKLFPVNYRDMGAEEFGSVYEGILELVPNYTIESQTFSLVNAAGNSRKTSGSYYTPSSLVNKQIDSALNPLIEAHKLDPASLLSLKIIDTSCGSGHFIVAAARRLASALLEARATQNASDTSTTSYQLALRDVITHCIYGVDINPLAVELAKITLWIESVVPGQPLSFLDSHLVCGDATLGLDNLDLLKKGIPQAAYKPLTLDDKSAASALSKQNRSNLKNLADDLKKGQLYLPTSTSDLSNAFSQLASLPESTLAEVEAKKSAYQRLLSSTATNRLVQAANLFTAAFLLPKNAADSAPTTTHLLARLTGSLTYQPPSDALQNAADQICRASRVLHWPLAFPDVFQNGGFDCILTNPPWDELQISEEEFFASRDPNIAALAGDTRKKAIAALEQTNPRLYQAFQSAVERQHRNNSFISKSERFTLSNVGKLNLYSVLTETILHVLNQKGRAGFIVPTGICTDASNKALFANLIESKRLAALFDFENAASGKKIFEAIDSRMKFCLLSLGPADQADFAFFLGQVADLDNPERHFSLSAADFNLINPNTKTAPIFRSKADAELAKRIYSHVGVLWNETSPSGNPWGLTFRQGLFNMTTASALFENEPGPNKLPLYEAKMIHQFDHRWATYEPNGETRDVLLSEKQDSNFEIRSKNYVDAKYIQEKLDGPLPEFFIGFRAITNATNERSIISAVIPCSAVGNSMIIYSSTMGTKLIACLLADLNSIPHDWCTRQKVGGTNMNLFIVKQIATLSPSAYSEDDINFIVPRVLELTYTSHALKGWAQALGYSGEPFHFNPDRRAQLRAELDARYAKLYGLITEDLQYILDPASTKGPDYPSESFRVLKDKELAEFGEFRTQRLVLEAWSAQTQGKLK